MAAFSEIREEIASGKVVAWGRNKTEEELELIRNLYAYLTRVEVVSLYEDIPACRLEYATETDDIPGCTRYAYQPGYTMNTTVLGWILDPNST